MRSRRGRSTGRPRRRSRSTGGVEVYLLPAVVGGGLGDIEEVLAAGRRLARAGFAILLYRRRGRPLPRSVDGPWEWPPHRRLGRLVPRAASALTVSPAWGVSAAPARPGRFGRPGPWAEEVADLESTYGPDHVLHVSLEEFARTLDARAENRERLREGGVPSRELRDRLRASERRGDVAEFRRAYERFRAFDRTNVLPLFATFEPDRRFARAFPAAVQSGPLWPDRYRRGLRRRGLPGPGPRDWVWYASPASAERIATRILQGLAGARPPVHLWVRSPRPWPSVPPSPAWTLVTEPVRPRVWQRRFAGAELRIVTGSRTLLEALELGGPFLYFNGVLGTGPRMRRHRPEKIRALLAAGRAAAVPAPILDDLDRFARGEGVAGVVQRRAARLGTWDRFDRSTIARSVPPPYDDAGAVVVAAARALARPGSDAAAIVASIRRGQNA